MTVTMDWAEMCAKYKGIHLALKDRNESRVTIVATGNTFEDAEANAKESGYDKAWIVFVQKKNTLFIGGGYEMELSDAALGEEVEVARPVREAADHSD